MPSENGTITSQTTYDFPKRGCTFLTTKVWFPSCWNGKPGRAYSLSPSDGPPNVQYPLLGGGLTGPNCPVGYERRIPSILVETFYFGVAGSDYQGGLHHLKWLSRRLHCSSADIPFLSLASWTGGRVGRQWARLPYVYPRKWRYYGLRSPVGRFPLTLSPKTRVN